MENIEKMLKEILDNQGEMKSDIKDIKEDVSVLKEDVSVLKEDVSVLKEDVSVLKEDVSVLKEDVSVLKDRMDSVYDQVAMLTQFRTETQDNFYEVHDTLKYLLYKETLTEKELFTLKAKYSGLKKAE